ncbi:MAG: hypothetical protein PHY02_07435 [Phycisphaerae bacterium]|nr:hypothetical protein [Phycisphaerae bacterium]
MEYLTILAEATKSSSEPFIRIQSVLDSIWEQVTALSWLQAVLCISFGLVYLLYGWRIFKVLVAICFGLFGLFMGINFGGRFGGYEILGGIAGLVLFASVSIPFMKWSVGVLGAISGGILTGGIWYAVGLPERFMPAGALMGIIAGGMISFIVFKAAVMLFTSFGGGILIITGMLSLIYHYESIQTPPTATAKAMLYEHHWFVPALLLAPTIIGIIVQHRFIKSSKSWDVKPPT